MQVYVLVHGKNKCMCVGGSLTEFSLLFSSCTAQQHLHECGKNRRMDGESFCAGLAVIVVD